MYAGYYGDYFQMWLQFRKIFDDMQIGNRQHVIVEYDVSDIQREHLINKLDQYLRKAYVEPLD